MKKLLVKNIGLLATPEGKSAHRGEEQGKIKFLKDAWVLVEDGIIASVGTGAVPAVEGTEVVDAEGHLVTPGLVDAHTHLIFGGWRQNELGLKLHGASYLDIQNAGGGIQSTTNATRQASEQELAAKASKALDEMMGFGTTTVEAKSGYGLATEHELKALEVIKDLNDHHRMDLVATFMGAHLVPAEYKSNREEYVRLVCEEMMPKVKEQGIAKFCDVFCEADTFTVEESRQVLEAGLKYGLRPKIHADEIAYVKEDKSEIGIEIHSGRNRIVRRIFESLGYSVRKLDRVYYAGLTKKNLKRGAWRFLTKEEVMRLKSGQYE